MSNVITFDRIQLRQGTAADLAAVNEVLMLGEPCIETDTGKLKIGDGVTTYILLPYLAPETTDDLAEGVTNLYFQEAPIDGSTYGRLNGAWALAGGGGGAMTLVGTATVAGAAATSVTLSGVDLDADSRYLIIFCIKNATAGALAPYLYYNADTTYTNYYSQSHTASHATITAGRGNTAQLCGVDGSGNVTGYAILARDIDGRARLTATFNRNTASAVALGHTAHVWNTVANVTSITFISSANSLAVGSYFKVWKIT